MKLLLTPDDLAAATEILRTHGDPRQAFCFAAARLLRADTAALWESRDGALHVVAATGTAPELGARLPLGPGSAAGRAAADGVRFFAGDARSDPDADPEIVRLLGLRSILAEPIRTAGRPTGALALGWKEPVEALDPLVTGLVSLMAVQSSNAIARGDLTARLERQALTDPLTGLPNRRGLARDLDREMARAARRGSPLGFAMLDIDHFKDYNDRHGHGEGDRLLVRAARAWAAQLRAQDTLSRYGGEEFVLLLPDCGVGASPSLEVIERVRTATPDEVTVSAGLAIWDGREPAHRLAERADAALYLAKETGRDRARAARHKRTL